MNEELYMQLIDSLQKSISKKVKGIEDNFCSKTNIYNYTSGECPNCSERILYNELIKTYYCTNCGQKLNWGDIEERIEGFIK